MTNTLLFTFAINVFISFPAKSRNEHRVTVIVSVGKDKSPSAADRAQQMMISGLRTRFTQELRTLRLRARDRKDTRCAYLVSAAKLRESRKILSFQTDRTIFGEILGLDTDVNTSNFRRTCAFVLIMFAIFIILINTLAKLTGDLVFRPRTGCRIFPGITMIRHDSCFLPNSCAIRTAPFTLTRRPSCLWHGALRVFALLDTL